MFWLQVDSCGRIHRARQKAMQADGPVAVLLQTANSETGVLQSVGEIAGAIHANLEAADALASARESKRGLYD
jgi:cysteine sulfinate desulfinase/cysteine desulfurase-like protein